MSKPKQSRAEIIGSEEKPRILTTGRLRLRPLGLDDGARIRELADNLKISREVSGLPYPYPPGAAAKWIAPQAGLWAARRGVIFGMEVDGELQGALGLERLYERRIELGYWLGEASWGQGYMSEAVAALIPFGFEHLPIDLLHARCLRRNLGSARVLEKNGFTEIQSRTKGVRRFERASQ